MASSGSSRCRLPESRKFALLFSFSVNSLLQLCVLMATCSSQFCQGTQSVTTKQPVRPFLKMPGFKLF